MSFSGDPPRLYNVEALFDPRDHIAICEGEIDAITAASADIPSVGVAGTNAWRDHWSNLFKGYTRVFFLGDSDPIDEKTGERAGDKLRTRVMRALGNVIPVQFPEGYDVNKFVCEFGAEALREKLELA